MIVGDVQHTGDPPVSADGPRFVTLVQPGDHPDDGLFVGVHGTLTLVDDDGAMKVASERGGGTGRASAR
jgi:hypothetical protein